MMWGHNKTGSQTLTTLLAIQAMIMLLMIDSKMVSNSLDNVGDGNVENAFVECMYLNSAADQRTTERDCRRVNQVDTFTTKPCMWLVFHYEHYVR